jgi:hypothetical protein
VWFELLRLRDVVLVFLQYSEYLGGECAYVPDTGCVAGVSQMANIDTRITFFIHFAHNLTVGCRSIWNDNDMPLSAKADQFRLMNEVMHTILTHLQDLQAGTRTYTDPEIWAITTTYIRRSPAIEQHIHWALREAYRSTITGSW